jgi:hypothetical protein
MKPSSDLQLHCRYQFPLPVLTRCRRRPSIAHCHEPTPPSPPESSSSWSPNCCPATEELSPKQKQAVHLCHDPARMGSPPPSFASLP